MLVRPRVETITQTVRPANFLNIPFSLMLPQAKAYHTIEQGTCGLHLATLTIDTHVIVKRHETARVLMTPPNRVVDATISIVSQLAYFNGSLPD